MRVFEPLDVTTLAATPIAAITPRQASVFREIARRLSTYMSRSLAVAFRRWRTYVLEDRDKVRAVSLPLPLSCWGGGALSCWRTWCVFSLPPSLPISLSCYGGGDGGQGRCVCETSDLCAKYRTCVHCHTYVRNIIPACTTSYLCVRVPHLGTWPRPPTSTM